MTVLKFIEGVLPGGTVKTDKGHILFEISSNGTSTVPPQQLQASIFERFKEAHLEETHVVDNHATEL